MPIGRMNDLIFGGQPFDRQPGFARSPVADNVVVT